LYHHLGLCPCPPVFDSEEFRISYKKNIQHVIDFLNGKTNKVIKDLESERDQFSNQQNYEEAKLIQYKILAINNVTSPRQNSLDYEINPNLLEDLERKRIKVLEDELNNNGVKVGNLSRIECYDISNISGTLATGSMVVFTNGAIDKSMYRRFRIKNPPKVIPNDFAMMKEVLSRRFNNNWPKPDLIIIDGGKGQVSSAKSILDQLSIEIPLIGLAKREETIITVDFREIKLKRDSQALLLIRSIRDEAHRFAITYHRKLRTKAYFLSTV
jgi:excinuclease ABC subunit C